MNIHEIVIAHLRAIGADGLAIEDCGCGLDDLLPCGGLEFFCEPAALCERAPSRRCRSCDVEWPGIKSEVYCTRALALIHERMPKQKPQENYERP